MALYGQNIIKESVLNNDDLAGINLKPFVELIAYDDISRCNEADIHEFVDSELATVLTEKQVLNKGTLMRLSKADDEKRRIKLVAYQLAKEADDPDWKKMKMYRDKWKEHRAKVMSKYGSKAKKIAKAAQVEYIKNARKAPTEPEKK